MKQTLWFAAIGLLSAALAHAGTVKISVTDKDGNPAADVVVLVDTLPKLAARAAPSPTLIEQQNSRFVPFLTVVPVGSTLRFVNRDTYDHHIRSTPSGPLGSMPAAMNISLRLDAGRVGLDNGYSNPDPAAANYKSSGQSSADVKVDQPGPIGLGCHIHGSMRGQIYVADTPWFAKTDAKGVAVIDGVPDGAADLKLWHPDQLQDQPPTRLQVGAAALPVSAQLNFVPRRRRN